jgi:hypothetical protein
MRPSSVLALYYVGLICLAFGAAPVIAALGLSAWDNCFMGASVGFAYAAWFWPRYRAYVWRWPA